MWFTEDPRHPKLAYQNLWILLVTQICVTELQQNCVQVQLLCTRIPPWTEEKGQKVADKSFPYHTIHVQVIPLEMDAQIIGRIIRIN